MTGQRLTGRDRRTGENHHPSLEIVCLTIPRRVHTQAHLDLTAQSVMDVYDGRAQSSGLGLIHELRYLRFFQACFERLRTETFPVGRRAPARRFRTPCLGTGARPGSAPPQLAPASCDA